MSTFTFSILLQGALKDQFLVKEAWKGNSEFEDHEKVNEDGGLQKVIGVWRQDQDRTM